MSVPLLSLLRRLMSITIFILRTYAVSSSIGIQLLWISNVFLHQRRPGVVPMLPILGQQDPMSLVPGVLMKQQRFMATASHCHAPANVRTVAQQCTFVSR
ncbi:hypothetical protein EDC04DRAFT_2741053 [Pisolithus marmoratus]|nr:hypothetical protein EDC04DRAFT_2741053 [Pisolithus marmoratus]